MSVVDADNSHSKTGVYFKPPPSLGLEAAEDFDWSSVEQVSSLVCKSTLVGLQQLWRQHATSMDSYGKDYAENMYNLHAKLIKEIANIKEFKVKPILELLKVFTDQCRESMLETFQTLRQQDETFTQSLYQTTRSAFGRNLRTALEARDAWHRDKVRALRSRHDAQIAAVRTSAAVEIAQRQTQLKIALARSYQGKGAAAANAALALAQRDGGGSLSARIDATLGNILRDVSTPMSGGSEGEGAAATSATASLKPHGEGGGGTMLEELFENATAADALNRRLEQELRKVNQQMEELKGQLETVKLQLHESQEETALWRGKWAVESSKTDSIKRESLAVLTKCEEHVSRLQQQHVSELTQRDYILQRCRDTIIGLETKIAELQKGLTGTSLPT